MIAFPCCFCGFDPRMHHVRQTAEGSNIRYVCVCGLYINRDNETEHLRTYFTEHAKCGEPTEPTR